MEKDFRYQISKHYKDGYLTMGRFVNLTGWSNYVYRNRCMHGCPLCAYFSINSSALPAAERTENTTLRPYSIVSEILYDDTRKRATGVKIIDAETYETLEFSARVIFC